MNRTELTMFVAGTLLLAVILGWCLRWFYSRLHAGAPVSTDSISARLHEAELAKEAAIARLAETERNYANLLTQAIAERDAAMESVGYFRHQVEDLQAELANRG
jgi:predicted alpha/beta hydrolase